MGDYTFPFASSGGDRKYNAQALAQFMAMLLSNGVPPVGTHLQVTVTSGMNVNVSGGLINEYGPRSELWVGVPEGILRMPFYPWNVSGRRFVFL